MTLAELLDAGLQLLGDVWTTLSFGCFTLMEDVNRSVWTGPGDAKTSLAPVDEFELLSRKFWHLAIGDREGSQCSEQ